MAMAKASKSILIALGVLALGVLACEVQAGTPNALGASPVGSLTPNALVVTPNAEFPYDATVTEPLALRSGAGEEYQRLGYFDPGDLVTVYGHVRAKDGGTWAILADGFVNSKYLSKK